jgi:hypothetical protein
MSVLDDFAEEMTDTVEVYKLVGVNARRDETYATQPVTYLGHVVWEGVDVRDAGGEDVGSRAHVYVPSATDPPTWPDISLRDHVVLPDTDPLLQTMPLIRIDKHSDEIGPHHVVLWL